MKNHARIFTIVSTLLVCGMGVQAAQAVDLTGTWEGSWSCKGFDGAGFKSFNKTSTMLITQTGGNIAVSLDGGSFTYNGGVIDSGKSPDTVGRGMMATCGITNNVFTMAESEMTRFSVKTTVGSPVASFKASSNFAGDDGSRYLGSCKYKYVRTSTTDPVVPACVM